MSVEGPFYNHLNRAVMPEDYTDEQREFLLAMDRWKRGRGRPHPTWAEVLTILRALGYRVAAAPVDHA